MSGIYIKGMEMPRVAGRIEAVIQIYKDGSAIIAISPAGDEIGYWKEYPLIPVPDHGRLIDADSLIDVLGIMGDKGGSPVVWQQMRYIAEDMPTIIPAEKEGEA